MAESKLRRKLKEILNWCSAENTSDTPDFILAAYLDDCLAAFDSATLKRTKWYSRASKEVGEGDA